MDNKEMLYNLIWRYPAESTSSKRIKLDSGSSSYKPGLQGEQVADQVEQFEEDLSDVYEDDTLEKC